ncbi:MAG: type VI secretion system protein TssA, partial [Azoarcus sp.]|nr:type VI secretion system protein TssA [Azoarcus sp.]
MADSIFDSTLFEPATSAGEDLEYVVAFSEFIALSTPREERQVGEHVIPAQPPNWSEVLKSGCSLLEKSRDLRILIKVCQAALHKYGLPGLAQGLALMARWIENDWDHLYPQVETDGVYDPLFRCNAILEMADRGGLVLALWQAPFLETSIGTVTMFAAEQALEGIQEEGSLVSSADQLSLMLVAEKDRNQDRLDAVSSISSSLASISSTFKARLEPEYRPDIDPLAKTVTRLERFVAEQLQEQEQQEQPSLDQTPGHENMGAAPKTPMTLPSALNSRTDACKALTLAREYFERHEPSHPAPLLIRRIERLCGSDFLAIIQELMPEAAN